MSTSTPLPRKSTVMALQFRQISSDRAQTSPPRPSRYTPAFHSLPADLQRFQKILSASRPEISKSCFHPCGCSEAPPHASIHWTLQGASTQGKIVQNPNQEFNRLDFYRPPETCISASRRPTRCHFLQSWPPPSWAPSPPGGESCSGDRLEETCHHYKYLHVLLFISASAVSFYVIVISLNSSGYFLSHIVLSAFDLIRSCYIYCFCFAKKHKFYCVRVGSVRLR